MSQSEAKKQQLVILGAGPFAEEVADLISEIEAYDPVAFVEGLEPERCRQPLMGLPVIWIDDVGQLDSSYLAVCAAGSIHRADFVQRAESLGMQFTTLVHPTARVSPTATLGEGTIVSAGTIIAARTVVGRHVIVNRLPFVVCLRTQAAHPGGETL